MGFTVKMRITGLEELIRRLESLDPKMRRKTLKAAVNAGSRILLAEMKAGVPSSLNDTGLLRKSLGRRIKVYRQSGIVVAIVGPRRGFKQEIGMSSSGKYKGKPIYRNPTRYAHLVEFGTGPRVQKSTGRSTGRMGARPFMRPALESSRGPVFDAMREVMEAGLAEAAQGK
jgi:HK97 gp10 family phage protein